MKAFLVTGSLCLSVSLSLCPSSAQEQTCSVSASPRRVSVSASFLDRGYSRTVSKMGSPFASFRHRLAQRALIRAQARAALAEAAALRASTSHVTSGPGLAAEADCSASIEAFPAVPEAGK